VAWKNLRLSSVIEKIPLAIIVTHPEGRIDYANSQAHLLLDMPEGSLPSRDVAEFRIGTRFLRAAPRLGDFESAKWRDQARYCTARGRQVWVLETLWPVHDDFGDVDCFIHFLQALHLPPLLTPHVE
jgi:PAS domain-containing protein